MSPNLTGLPQRYLRTPEAARFVGLSILEKHRSTGPGRAIRKLGGRVVYRVEDLQAQDATSDPGVGTVPAGVQRRAWPTGVGMSGLWRLAGSTVPTPGSEVEALGAAIHPGSGRSSTR